MIITSNQNLHYYPDNRSYSFKVKLRQTVELNGYWKIALTEIELNETNNTKETLYIYANICGESIINGVNEPLLRRVAVFNNQNTVFTSYYYIPVIKSELNEIEITVKTADGRLADQLTQPITLVAHFRSYPFYS